MEEPRAPKLRGWVPVKAALVELLAQLREIQPRRPIQYYAKVNDAPKFVRDWMQTEYGWEDADTPILVLDVWGGSESNVSDPKTLQRLVSFTEACNCCEVYTLFLDKLLRRSGVTNNGAPLRGTYRARTRLCKKFNPLVYTVYPNMRVMHAFVAQEPMTIKDPKGEHSVLLAEFTDGSTVAFDATARQNAPTLESLDDWPEFSVYEQRATNLVAPLDNSVHAMMALQFCEQLACDESKLPRLLDLYRHVGWDRALADYDQCLASAFRFVDKEAMGEQYRKMAVEKIRASSK